MRLVTLLRRVAAWLPVTARPRGLIVALGLVFVALLPAVAGGQVFVEPPAPRRVLDDAAYAERSAAALLRFPTPGAGELERWRELPLVAWVFRRFDPDGPLAAAEVGIGDAVLTLAGRDVTDMDAFEDAEEAADEMGGGATARVLSPARGEVEVAWPEGHWKQVIPGFVPQAAYAQVADVPDDPALEAALRVALVSWLADPPLAETALARLWEAGHRGPLVSALAAEALRYQNRPSLALPHALAAIGYDGQEMLPEAAERRSGQTALNAALLTGDLPLAANLLHSLPALHDRWWRGRVEALNAAAAVVEAAGTDALQPIARADAAPSFDISHQIRGIDANHGDPDRIVAQLARHGKYGFWIPAGHFGYVKHDPGTRDFDLSLDLTFSANEPYSTRWSNTVALGVVDLDDPDLDLIAKLWIGHDGRVGANLDGRPQTITDLAPVGPKDRRIVRLAVVGTHLELTIEGERILRAPLPAEHAADPDRALGFYIQYVGTKGAIRDLVYKDVRDEELWRQIRANVE